MTSPTHHPMPLTVSSPLSHFVAAPNQGCATFRSGVGGYGWLGVVACNTTRMSGGGATVGSGRRRGRAEAGSTRSVRVWQQRAGFDAVIVFEEKKGQGKCWKYPWPNLWVTRNLITRSSLLELQIFHFLLMVAIWEIHMVLMVVVVLDSTSL